MPRVITVDKLNQFTTCLADGLDAEQVQKKLGMSRSTFYKYKDKLEEVVDNYAMFMIEAGLILKVKTSMERLEKMRDEYDDLLEKAKASKNNWQVLHALNAMSSHEKTITEMLNNGVVAKRIRNVLDRVIVEGPAALKER